MPCAGARAAELSVQHEASLFGLGGRALEHWDLLFLDQLQGRREESELVRYFVTMWCRYPDIDQASEHHINKINTTVRSEGSDAEFVVLEKVDGNNFAFETDGRVVTYFSRERQLDKDANFVRKTHPA